MKKSPKKNTEELKQANSKTVKINGQKKLLLMDDEEDAKSLEQFVETCVKELFEQTMNENFIDETNYPEGFNVNDFKSLSDYQQKIKYARKFLGKHIGKGTSRIVFAIDQNTVVKIALDRKGLFQNSAEIEIAATEPQIVAKVLSSDDNFYYLEMERARKIAQSDWKRSTGHSFQAWMNTLRNKIIDLTLSTAYKQKVPDDFEDIEETPFFKEVINFILNYGVSVGDIARITSWGIVIRDGKTMPVIIDYGLTNSNAQYAMP